MPRSYPESSCIKSFWLQTATNTEQLTLFAAMTVATCSSGACLIVMSCQAYDKELRQRIVHSTCIGAVQAGETLAELVAADVIPTHAVIDILHSSGGDPLDDTTCQRCCACLASCFIRLSLLGRDVSSPCCIEDLDPLLQQILPKVLQQNCVCLAWFDAWLGACQDVDSIGDCRLPASMHLSSLVCSREARAPLLSFCKDNMLL